MMEAWKTIRCGVGDDLPVGFSFEWENQAARNGYDLTPEAALELNARYQIVARGRHHKICTRIEAIRAISCGPSFPIVNGEQILRLRESDFFLKLEAAAFYDWAFELLALLDAFVVRGEEREARMQAECDANPNLTGLDSGSGVWGSSARIPAYSVLARACEELGAALAPPSFYDLNMEIIECGGEPNAATVPTFPMLVEASELLGDLPADEELEDFGGDFDIAALKAAHCEIVMEPCSALRSWYERGAILGRDELANRTAAVCTQLELIAREAHYTHKRDASRIDVLEELEPELGQPVSETIN